MPIKKIKRSDRFKQEYKKLKPDIKKEADDCIKDLYKDPIPKKRKFKKYNELRNPTRYAVHVTSNHSHKISLELDGEVATLRRISTHKKIDAAP